MASASENELEVDADSDAGDVVSRGVGGSKVDNNEGWDSRLGLDRMGASRNFAMSIFACESSRDNNGTLLSKRREQTEFMEEAAPLIS